MFLNAKIKYIKNLKKIKKEGRKTLYSSPSPVNPHVLLLLFSTSSLIFFFIIILLLACCISFMYSSSFYSVFFQHISLASSIVHNSPHMTMSPLSYLTHATIPPFYNSLMSLIPPYLLFHNSAIFSKNNFYGRYDLLCS